MLYWENNFVELHNNLIKKLSIKAKEMTLIKNDKKLSIKMHLIEVNDAHQHPIE